MSKLWGISPHPALKVGGAAAPSAPCSYAYVDLSYIFRERPNLAKEKLFLQNKKNRYPPGGGHGPRSPFFGYASGHTYLPASPKALFANTGLINITKSTTKPPSNKIFGYKDTNLTHSGYWSAVAR